jgi:uncharacterized membrane protein YkoI
VDRHALRLVLRTQPRSVAIVLFESNGSANVEAQDCSLTLSVWPDISNARTMKRYLPWKYIILAIGLLLVSLHCTPLWARPEAAKKVSFDGLPAAVKQTVQGQLGGGAAGDVERDEEEGEVSYVVTISKDGKEHDVTVATDGRLLSLEVELAETPAAVQKTIQEHLRGASLDGVEKAFEEDGSFRYDVDSTTKGGDDRSFAVAADGKLLNAQVTLEEVPAAVRKGILDHAGAGKLGDIYWELEDGQVSYDVEMTKDGKDRDFSVGADGKLESEQVFPGELPPLGQRTLKERIGNGKLIRIDKTMDDGMFHAESRKEGKEFDFKIGPGGRFRGLE